VRPVHHRPERSADQVVHPPEDEQARGQGDEIAIGKCSVQLDIIEWRIDVTRDLIGRTPLYRG
jgi:hypothetical protein